MNPVLLCEDGVYRIRYHDGERTRYKSLKTSDPATALSRMAKWLGTDPVTASEPGLLEILARYRDEYVPRHTAKGSRPNLLSILNRFEGWLEIVAPDAGVGDLRKLSVGWLDERQAAGRAPSTIRKELVAVVAAANWAQREGLVATVPAVDLPAAGRGKHRWLKDPEVQRLLKAASEAPKMGRGVVVPRVEAFCRLALITGARKRALETLRWDQVDMDELVIDFRDGEDHGGKRRVPVPLPRERLGVADMLRKMHGAPGRGELVLYNDAGIYEPFVRAVKRARLGPDVTPHTLRHTFATRMLQRGVSLYDVARIMGDTVQTVDREYGHHAASALRKTVYREDFERGVRGKEGAKVLAEGW